MASSRFTMFVSKGKKEASASAYLISASPTYLNSSESLYPKLPPLCGKYAESTGRIQARLSVWISIVIRIENFKRKLNGQDLVAYLLPHERPRPQAVGTLVGRRPQRCLMISFCEGRQRWRTVQVVTVFARMSWTEITVTLIDSRQTRIFSAARNFQGLSFLCTPLIPNLSTCSVKSRPRWIWPFVTIQKHFRNMIGLLQNFRFSQNHGSLPELSNHVYIVRIWCRMKIPYWIHIEKEDLSFFWKMRYAPRPPQPPLDLQQ